MKMAGSIEPQAIVCTASRVKMLLQRLLDSISDQCKGQKLRN